MAVIVTVELSIKPEAFDEFKATIKAALPDTRKFSGCRVVTVGVPKDRPNTLFLYEEWDAVEDQEKYIAWRTETGMMEAIGKIAAAEPKITVFDMQDM